MIKKLSFLAFIFTLSACVYRLDIQQGNILAQRDIDKLRPELTKNQVVFVLGSPVIEDSFTDDKWTYLYSYENPNRGIKNIKKLELIFKDDKLISAEGDYEIPEALKVKSTN
ncbi:outer membrane protein assembly factor BamE [Aliikangiella sp. IMCC44359]|uniref:outer membrane protein assembly factor BamE n=1 Tax=Aliikangiella sp. IMCC44359 TaxID=3459125 RepID=UPI00403ABE9A